MFKLSFFAALAVSVLGMQVMAEVSAPAAKPEISMTTMVTNDEGEHLLADSRGNTLYVFDLDQGKAGSACSAACAEVWPPYLLQNDEVAKLSGPLGKIERENHKIQLTFNGRPVYTYAFDRGAAADAGDGVGDVWHYIELK